jgi:quinolinate synthase
LFETKELKMNAEKIFIEQILKNLETHGHPEKRVSLPLEKMYEAADNKGLSFNAILKTLKEEHHIDHLLETERVIFFPLAQKDPEAFSLNPDDLKSMDQDELKKKAQDLMQSMTPEKMAEIQRALAGMGQDEKDDLMRKGKEMGLL